MKKTVLKKGLVMWVGVAVLMTLLVTPQSAAALDLSYLSYLTRIRYLSNSAFNLPARDLNGIYLNGQYLDERYVVSVSLDNVRVKKNKTASLYLFGTMFMFAGKIEGVEFSATVDDGSLLTLRVDKMVKSKLKTDWDVLRYLVSYQSDEGWKPLCGTDSNGEPIAAVPLSGTWDYSTGTEGGGDYAANDRSFTFACDGYVIEKCVSAGYKPWNSVFVCYSRYDCEWVSLAPYHQACTRMLRADFCGDGTSYTEENIMVALYDSLGIRVDTEEWNEEAEWDEDGAICSAAPRLETLVPACAAELMDETCGDKTHLQTGARIISELP